MSEQFVDLLTVVGTLLLMILVFVGAYFVSRLVGGSYAYKHKDGGSQVQVLDRIFMGKDKSLVVVRVADKVLLLGVTPQQIQKIDELDPALFVTGAQGPASVDFRSVLKDAWQQRTGKQDKGDGSHE